MTDKQKQALRVLRRLLNINGGPLITMDEWFLLFDIVVGDEENITLIIPKDLKGTDPDGGVVGEIGEQGEQPTNKNSKERYKIISAYDWFKETHQDISISEEQIESLKKRIEDNQLGCIVQRLDKIIELLQSAILPLSRSPYIPPIIYKNPLDPNPNTLGGWGTNALLYGADYDIDTDKIKQDETSKSKS